MAHYMGTDLYEALGPITETDESGDLLKLCGALGHPFGQIEDLARDDDEHPGWSIIMDVDRAPAYALPWLAQFAGVRPTRGASATQHREEIRLAAGQKRGTVASIVAEAQRHLTGNKFVAIVERDGSPYRLTVVTRTSETADSDAVRNAILAVKPAGIVLNYIVTPSQTWNEATATFDASSISWDAATTQST